MEFSYRRSISCARVCRWTACTRCVPASSASARARRNARVPSRATLVVLTRSLRQGASTAREDARMHLADIPGASTTGQRSPGPQGPRPRLEHHKCGLRWARKVARPLWRTYARSRSDPVLLNAMPTLFLRSTILIRSRFGCCEILRRIAPPGFRKHSSAQPIVWRPQRSQTKSCDAASRRVTSCEPASLPLP